MTRARAIALAAAALLAACTPAVVRAEGDWCPPDSVPSTTTATTTTEVPVTSTTEPAGTTTTTVAPAPTTTIVGPADPIVQPPRPVDYCVDTNGDGVGSTSLSLMVCFTTAEAELWVTTVWQIANTYQVSHAIANALLIALLTGS